MALSVYKKEVILAFQKFMADKGYLFKYKQCMSRMYQDVLHYTGILGVTPPTEWLEMISQVEEDEPLWSDLPEGHHVWAKLNREWVAHWELLDALQQELLQHG